MARKGVRAPTYDKSLLLHPPPGTTVPRLPISERAVHEVLLAQPRTQMLASELAALFSAKSGAQRQQLTRAASRVATLVPTAAGPALRLRAAAPPAAAPPAAATPRPIDAHAVRRLLAAQPVGQMEMAHLAAHFRPASEAERRALARAVAEVAELIVVPSAGGVRRYAHLLPPQPQPQPQPRARERPQRAAASPPVERRAAAEGGGGEEAVPVTSMERELVRKLLMGAPGGAMRSEDIARMLSADSDQARRRLALVVSQVARAVRLPDGRGGAGIFFMLRETAAADEQPRSPPPRGDEGEAPHPAGVSEERVVQLLRAKGGRMPSQVLITRMGPLDRKGRDALAAIVQRVARTVLPSSRGGSATIVLRETLLRERLEQRAAGKVQRAARAWRDARGAAAVKVQSRARGVAGRRRAREEAAARGRAEAAKRREEAAKRREEEEARRRRVEAARAREEEEARAREAEARARREERREWGATRVQAHWRRAAAARLAARLRESPDAAEARRERERKRALRQKLLARRRVEASGAREAAAEGRAAEGGMSQRRARGAAAAGGAPPAEAAHPPREGQPAGGLEEAGADFAMTMKRLLSEHGGE
ncbi:hypothetical protein AB1Y20_021118 [Prymnesium parvum]|uniref:Uncharacterized protein n=1 Tax=Prymnesium parvum TaxID=97485 RepID=A0AB34JLD2_PRYPA